MSNTIDAIWRGVRRGASMGVAPSSTRLQEMSRRAASIDFTQEAMEMVTETLSTEVPVERLQFSR